MFGSNIALQMVLVPLSWDFCIDVTRSTEASEVCFCTEKFVSLQTLPGVWLLVSKGSSGSERRTTVDEERRVTSNLHKSLL